MPTPPSRASAAEDTTKPDINAADKVINQLPDAGRDQNDAAIARIGTQPASSTNAHIKSPQTPIRPAIKRLIESIRKLSS